MNNSCVALSNLQNYAKADFLIAFKKKKLIFVSRWPKLYLISVQNLCCKGRKSYVKTYFRIKMAASFC